MPNLIAYKLFRFFKGLTPSGIAKLVLMTGGGILMIAIAFNFSAILDRFGFETRTELKSDLTQEKIVSDLQSQSNKELIATIVALQKQVAELQKMVVELQQEKDKLNESVASKVQERDEVLAKVLSKSMKSETVKKEQSKSEEIAIAQKPKTAPPVKTEKPKKTQVAKIVKKTSPVAKVHQKQVEKVSNQETKEVVSVAVNYQYNVEYLDELSESNIDLIHDVYNEVKELTL